MYAILKHGGHQYRVAAGDHLVVDRLPAEVGDVVGLEPVLLLSDGDGVRVAAPELAGVRVAATVVGHHRGRKLRVFTFKPKKRHRRTLGFRAELTELVVGEVLARDQPLPERARAEAVEPVAIEAAPVEEVTEVAEPPAEPAPRRARARRAGAAAPPAEAEASPPATPSHLRQAWGAGEAPAAAGTESEPAATEAAEAVTSSETPSPRASTRRRRAAPAAEPGETPEPEALPPPARPVRRRAQRRDQSGEETE